MSVFASVQRGEYAEFVDDAQSQLAKPKIRQASDRPFRLDSKACARFVRFYASPRPTRKNKKKEKREEEEEEEEDEDPSEDEVSISPETTGKEEVDEGPSLRRSGRLNRTMSQNEETNPLRKSGNLPQSQTEPNLRKSGSLRRSSSLRRASSKDPDEKLTLRRSLRIMSRDPYSTVTQQKSWPHLISHPKKARVKSYLEKQKQRRVDQQMKARQLADSSSSSSSSSQPSPSLSPSSSSEESDCTLPILVPSALIVASFLVPPHMKNLSFDFNLS